MVLVGPGACWVEKERLAKLLSRTEECVLDSVGDHVDAFRLEVEPLECARADEFTRDDHRDCALCRAVVAVAPEDAPRA